MKVVFRQLLDRRAGRRVTQQALGRHHDQRFAEVAHLLAPQHMEHLGRRRRDANLHIVFGTELQESFEPGRGMLGSLSFVAVRQEHRDPGRPVPLGQAAGDELVAGERRLRAAKMVGLAQVPVVMKDITNAEMLEMSIVENIQRADFNPIDSSMNCHIHFAFPDGSRMERAFSYAWRLWTLPEIRELLLEAGFREVTVYWEGTDEASGEGNGVYEPAVVGDADPGWVCYIVAQP